MKMLGVSVAVVILCLGLALSGCTRTVIATPDASSKTPTTPTAPVVTTVPTVQENPPVARVSVDSLVENVITQTTSQYLRINREFAHILYTEVRRAQRVTSPTEIGLVTDIRNLMWRKIVWTKMEMYREQRFREFFSLLQYKLEEELETATIQGKIESQVVYVPLTNVLQAIADATVPYCPGVCLHY